MIEAGQLRVGPLCWDLYAGAAGVSYGSHAAYAGFYHPAGAQEDGGTLVRMPVTLNRAALSPPDREPLFSAGWNWSLWEDDGDLVCCAGFHERATAHFHCRFARGLDRAELSLDPALEAGAPAAFDAPLRFPIDQILSWGMLGRCGGLLLHAAVAVRDGYGWVFAGRSGAGKSTLSELCHAQGWRILNDDRVMVFLRGDRLMVAGTPWHGSGRYAEPAEVPLGGMYFIRQAAQERIEELSPHDARLQLIDIASVPWFEDTWAQDTLDVVEYLVENARLHRFHFTKSPSAVRALEASSIQARAASA